MASKSPEALAKRAAYQREYARERRKSNPNPHHYRQHGRNGHLKRKYGISEATYQMLYRLRDGHCDICRTFCEQLVVDHQHGTKDIRGLLCKSCNTMLGYAYDLPMVLRLGAAYLERSKQGVAVIPWDKAQNLLKELDGK